VTRAKLPTVPKEGQVSEAQWHSAPPDFTPGSVRAALVLAETGDLSQAAQVCDAIMSDGRLRGLLQTRSNALLGCELEFEKDGDARRSAGPAKVLEDGEFWEMASEADQSRVMHWGWLLNKGLAEKVWEREPDGERRWIQKLVPRHPRNLHRSTDGKMWLLATADGVDVEVTPGDGRWLLYQPWGDTTAPQVGLWYALALLWLSATFAEFDWSRRNEARATGGIVGTSDDKTNEVDKGDVEDFGRMLAKFRQSPAIALPPGYDVKAVDFGQSDHETFQAKGDRAYSSASILVLGQTLSTEVQGGSLAATKEHNKVRQDYVEFDEATWTTCLRQQYLRSWAAVRYSDPGLAPWPKFDTEPDENLVEAADTTQKATLALVQLLDKGLDIDIQKFCDRFKIPIKSDVVKAPAAPVVVAPPNGQQPPASPAAPPAKGA
jgi:hypothetical protein